MVRKKVKISLIFAAIIITTVAAFMLSASEVTSDPLFTLTRNLDEDELHYVLNYEDGKLSENDPIKYYWKLSGDSGGTKDLNSLQKNFAYGLKYTAKKEEYYEFHLVSYKHDLYLKRSSLGTYHVLSQFEGKFVIVNHIFIQVDKVGTLAKLPKVPYVDVHWYSPKDKVKGVTRVDVNKK